MKIRTTKTIPRLGRGLLSLSALVMASACSAEGAEPDTALEERTETRALAQTVLPNCQTAQGIGWRLVKNRFGWCSFVRPNLEGVWVTSGPLPPCSQLWQMLGCREPSRMAARPR
jgi:hypothetical protein